MGGAESQSHSLLSIILCSKIVTVAVTVPIIVCKRREGKYDLLYRDATMYIQYGKPVKKILNMK